MVGSHWNMNLNVENTQGMGICFQLCHERRMNLKSFQNGDERMLRNL